jgi:hypothetical protein
VKLDEFLERFQIKSEGTAALVNNCNSSSAKLKFWSMSIMTFLGFESGVQLKQQR